VVDLCMHAPPLYPSTSTRPDIGAKKVHPPLDFTETAPLSFFKKVAMSLLLGPFLSKWTYSNRQLWRMFTQVLRNPKTHPDVVHPDVLRNDPRRSHPGKL
jgi:hypothetical protein